MEQLFTDSLTKQRFNVLLMGIFAVLALTLAAVGIYGLLLFSLEKPVDSGVDYRVYILYRFW